MDARSRRSASDGAGADASGVGAGAGGGAETIKVMARVRPQLGREGDFSDVTTVRGSTLTVRGGATGTSRYKFDRVFSQSAGQADVFALVKPLLEAAFQGYNATVFAYGQTGTGKTHTMLGVDMWSMAVSEIRGEGRSGRGAAPEVSALRVVETATHHKRDWGIIPRAMQHIFRHIESSASTSIVTVKVSYLELYNEKVFDLLRFDDGTKSRSGPGMDIRHHKRHGVMVPDATEVPVSSEADLLALLWRGAQNRAVSATDMNEHSSRSHTILQVMLEQRPRDRGSGTGPLVITRSKINLVDLAGSEKIKTHATFSERRLQELTSINQSLSNLGNCIRALGQANRSHIPYRNSKLTRLLQDSLGGNTKTTFIVTLSPSEDAIEETLSTLQFANRAKKVTVHASVNEALDDESVMRQQAHEIARLKKLLQAAARSNRGGGTDESAARHAPDGSSDDEAEGDREDMIRLRKDNLALAEQLQRVQQELLAARDDRRRLLSAAARRGMNAAALAAGRSDDDEDEDEMGGGEEAIAAALELMDIQTKSFEQQRQSLERAEVDLAAKEQLLEKYHSWLRSLPLQDNGDDDGAQSPSSDDTPSSTTARGRLHLLEWSVLMQREELARAKRLFLRDLTDLQAVLLDKSSELEEAERKLLLRGAGGGSDGGGSGADDGADGGDEAAASAWTQHVDAKSQRSYYHNASTGETTWVRPKSFGVTGGSKVFRRQAADAVESLRTQLVGVVRTHAAQLSEALVSSVEFKLDEDLATRRSDEGKPSPGRDDPTTPSRTALRVALSSTLSQHLDDFQEQMMAAQARRFAGFAAKLGLR